MQWAILLIVHWGSSCVPIWMHITLDCLGFDSASGSDRYVIFQHPVEYMLCKMEINFDIQVLILF
jgi:hypothetical protein